MSGGKGGSQTQKVEIPAWLQGPVVENLARAKDVSQLDYMPYMGPSVAAFTPMQEAAFQNTSQAAGAFGMAGGGMTGMDGMPQPEQFAGGVRGYSDFPIYEQARNLYAQYDPATFAARNALFGAAPSAGVAAPTTPAAGPSAATVSALERQAGLTPEMKAMGMTINDLRGP